MGRAETGQCGGRVPFLPELQGGRLFITSLHPDGSLGSCWDGVQLQGEGHSQIAPDSQMVLFWEGM